MAKDPAFLLYFQDYLIGTILMEFDEKGAYMDVLCHMADKGRLTEVQILKLLKGDTRIWKAICHKFKCENDLYYNVKLEKEVKKRKEYTESRRKNLHMGDHMDSNTEPHMESGCVDSNKNKEKRGLLRGEFDKFWEVYPRKVGKGQAFKAFIGAIEKTESSNILKAIKIQKPYLLEYPRDKVPHASTWLNGERWEDRPEDLKIQTDRQAKTYKPSGAEREYPDYKPIPPVKRTAGEAKKIGDLMEDTIKDIKSRNINHNQS